MNIAGCVALVTGANRGLGKSFCEALVAAGASKIYAAARDPHSVKVSDKRIIPVELDITREHQVKALAEQGSDVSLLINNAGILKESPMLADDSDVALRAELEVNVFGTLRMVRAFAPVLASNEGGAIVNILSVASWLAFPHNATYGASKHGALALTDAIRFQLDAQGTQVVGVFSGYIDTDMATSVRARKISPLRVAERTLAGVHEGRNKIYADDKTERIWKILTSDPEAFHAFVQADWNSGLNR